MRHVLAFVLGIVAGGLLAIGFVFFVPASQPGLTPLDISDGEQIALDFSGVADEAILFTNDGESAMSPQPERVQQLWEPTITETSMLVTTLRNMRGEQSGIGIKFVSLSERTRILNGEVLADSIWYVYLPGKGTMLIEQSENYWDFMREIVIPAYWNSDDAWRGSWRGTTTAGPGALGTGRVYGGSGVFQDVEAEAIETLTAAAYSLATGPVALEGRLLVELPRDDSALSADSR
jgi:hypothetical protein